MTPVASKEFVLNYAMNRWQLNFKRNVGPTSDSIRECRPTSLEDWTLYYYAKVRAKSHIDELGRELFYHISVDLPGETRFHPDLLDVICEKDCIDYMHQMVIVRTYNGYRSEREG